MRRLRALAALAGASLVVLGPSAGVALAANASAITATEGQSFNGVVDTFTCPNGSGRVAKVSIDWGDQTVTTGTPNQTGPTTCTISGIHTYAEEGGYTTHVVYTNGPGAGNDTGSATVTDVQPNANSAGTFSAAAGASVGGVMATFTDPAPEPLSSYSATIDWGEGQSSPGSVSSGFSVSGSHTYTYGGTYTITVAIRDEGGASASPHDTAAISGCPTAAPSTPSPAFTPTATGLDDRYVQALYNDLLGRPPSASDLQYANRLLSAGATRYQLVLSILQSPAYRQALIGAAISAFLGRPADGSAVSFYLGQLQAGVTDEALDAQILGTDEYFAKVNGSSDAFLGALYCETVFRGIDQSGQAFFETALAQGASRTTVAADVLRSTEYLSDRVSSYFLRFLRRPADQSGLNSFVNVIRGGGTDEQVIATLMSSLEYYQRFNHTAAVATILLPNGVIHTTISRPATLKLTVLHVLHAARDAAAIPSVVPRTHMVGVVNFGSHRKGRVTLHWNRKVGRHRLARGSYLLLLRAYHGGKVIYVSDALPFKVR